MLLAMHPYTWKVSPSDLAFLWDDCKRCFYRKVVQGIRRPRGPLPAIFTRIATLEASYFNGRRTEELVPELPPGTFRFKERRVMSHPIHLTAKGPGCQINGRCDMIMMFDDGHCGVVDFKTTEPRPLYLGNYGRQLGAYCYGFENADDYGIPIEPISMMGLLCLDPTQIVRSPKGSFWLRFRPTWVPFERDDAEFLRFMGQVAEVLDAPQPPLPSVICEFCKVEMTGDLRPVPYRAHG